jgi:glycosyltransferase involved in cell wall biosynthesis
VLKQTYKDFELLIVDDGSTDNSVKVVEGIQDPRIRLISIKNSGVSVARNTGIEAARKPWIAFLDADDWWAPTFLEELMNAIKVFPDNVLFASGRCRVFASEEERYAHPLLPANGETTVLNYFQVIAKYLPLINSSNAVIKRSHFDAAGYFREGQRQHEDHDLWMRLVINESVVFVNNKLSYYRKVKTGSASDHVYKATDFNRFLQTILEVCEKSSEENRIYLKQYANRFAALTYLKHYGKYSKDERLLLSEPLGKLLFGTYKKMYTSSCILPFNLYPLLKSIRG